MTTRAGAIAALVLASACALVASKREYGVFRQITQTQDPVELASLYRTYTTEFPDGAYSGELDKMRPEMERELFMAAGEDRELLKLYIDVFPQGIYAKLAGDKIRQIEAAILWQAEQAAALEAQRLAELQAAEAKRQALLAAFNGALAGWTAFAGQAPYGMTVEQLAGSSPWFFDVWSSEPLATCDATSCVKHYLFDTWYQNTGGTRVESALELAVKLVFQSGTLMGVSVTLPHRGVLPLLEQRDQVSLDLTESLAEATAMVIDTLRIAASEAMPEGQEQEPQAQDVLWSWVSPQARISLVRSMDAQAGVSDALLIELVPPPPPEPPPPPPGVKPPKPAKPKKGEPVPPPPPVVDPADLHWHPAPPAAPEAGQPIAPQAAPPQGQQDAPAAPQPPAAPGAPSGQ